MTKKYDNTNILYTIIAILALMLVWLVWYFLWQKWNNSTNTTINSNETPLIVEAWNMWIDKEELKQCIKSDKYLDKINSQMKTWADNFGITWTPGNVIINNETWEYEIISWAHPKESFITLIDILLSDEAPQEQQETNKKDFKEKVDENTIILITDKRDKSTAIDQIIEGIKKIDSIKSMQITNYDFWDNWVSEYITENEIKTLPAIIFAKEKIDSNIDKFLVKLKNNSYSLDIWAKFDPFAKMSPRWFKLIDKKLIEKIKKDSYIDGDKKAQITWLEYSELECPFCAKLHNWDVEESLKAKYGSKLNIVFNHFPLKFHKKAIPWAKILECVWEQGWSEAFYKIMRYAFKNNIQE